MTGGRLNRFNIVKQSKDYDQHGDYVKLWCPELKSLPKEFVHEPWKMNQFQQMELNCKLGVDYPNPIVPPSGPRLDRGKGGSKEGGKQRKPNNNRNRHQKHEMKSLKQGDFNMK
jgi:deoxyribodipyrimidine photo-lyase